MSDNASSKRFCIIGAGACGIAAVKNFKERGIPFDCFEQEADIGGIWNPDCDRAVYETTHLNTSKRLSRYTDFPMPEAYPQFLSRSQALDYVRAYARHFGLYDHITFNTRVETVAEVDGRWQVTLSGEDGPRLYDGVVIANGHHWDPKWPDYPGEFTGEVLHAYQVKKRDQLRGKRVLVVGAGNTGCDLAADAALSAREITHSMRRTYYFLPKFAFGRPLDLMIDLTSRWPLPRALLRRLWAGALYVLVGPYEKYGLPKPDHKLMESHPTSASSYLDHLAHGRIAPKPEIAELKGDRVRFTDGSEVEVDLVIYATGYHISFPFMDRDYFLTEDGGSRLFLHIFHRRLDTLFTVGLVQPADGGFWQLADYQGQLIANFIVAQERDPAKADWFRKLKATTTPDVSHGVTYLDSQRHKHEVAHYRYRTYMKRLIAKFGPVAEASFPAQQADEPAQTESSRESLQLAS